MKKSFTLLLMILACTILFACGGNGGDSSPAPVIHCGYCYVKCGAYLATGDVDYADMVAERDQDLWSPIGKIHDAYLHYVDADDEDIEYDLYMEGITLKQLWCWQDRGLRIVVVYEGEPGVLFCKPLGWHEEFGKEVVEAHVAGYF